LTFGILIGALKSVTGFVYEFALVAARIFDLEVTLAAAQTATKAGMLFFGALAYSREGPGWREGSISGADLLVAGRGVVVGYKGSSKRGMTDLPQRASVWS